MYLMSKRLVSLLHACTAVLLLVSVAGRAYADQDAIVTGAGAHFAWVVFDSLKADLEKASGRSIELHGRNSTLGMGCNAGIKTALLNAPGHETFGFVCCPLSKEEVDSKKLLVYPIALEPVLIVVNRANPVSNLSADQVRGIMRGDIVNWSEVGGNDEPIVLVTRLHCKKRPGHWKTILPDAAEFRQKRLNVGSAADMVQRVGDFSSALGHIGSTWDFGSKSNLKVLSVDGYQPSAENLRNKHYPFFRNLSAVTNQTPGEDVLKIIHEVQTGPAFKAVAKRYNLLQLETADKHTQ
jgi:ABC-type phosphate transport system substrate-binding protein